MVVIILLIGDDVDEGHDDDNDKPCHVLFNLFILVVVEVIFCEPGKAGLRND